MLVEFYRKPFFIFLTIVLIVYWLTPSRHRNKILLISSYIFYGSWSIKYLNLIFISTIVDYYCGLKISTASTQGKKKSYLFLSLLTNLSLLGFFKYYNFFVESFNIFSTWAGIPVSVDTIKIILPLGISFYTFQTLSYTLDIYKGRLAPRKNIFNFALFVSYFPQIIAGPIERASDLLPRLESKKYLKEVKFKEGLYLFCYGLFKKIVIADYLGHFIKNIYSSENPSPAQLAIASYAFLFQIYCDFSGYSTMARGISRFFGIKLTRNFNFPLFAKSPSDFWNRWHITLSSWVKSYLFIPILLRSKSPYCAAIISIPLMGLWHGPSINYFLWGLYWLFLTMAFQPIDIFIKKCNYKSKVLGKLQVFIMFHLTVASLIIFKIDNLERFKKVIITFFSSKFNWSEVLDMEPFVGIVILFLLIYEYIMYKKNDQYLIVKQNDYFLITFLVSLYFMYRQTAGIAGLPFYYIQF